MLLCQQRSSTLILSGIRMCNQQTALLLLALMSACPPCFVLPHLDALLGMLVLMLVLVLSLPLPTNRARKAHRLQTS